MTGIRRGLLVLGLTVAATLSTAGSTAPAQATFADSAAVSTEVKTMRVLEATSLSGSLTCGRSTSTMSLTWKRSLSTRVAKQQVKVYFSDGLVQTVDLGPTATSWSASIDTYYVTAYSIDYAVTTITDYGWSRESSKQGQFHC
jgi:hypothetical protein